MLTLEQWEKLEVGDLIEADPVLPGLSKEPLVVKVTVADQPAGEVLVEAFAFDVSVGKWAVSIRTEGRLVWEEL